MDRTKILIIDNISKSFSSLKDDGLTPVLDNVSLSVNQGEIVSIVGPSGCGKSTLLNIVAGFIKPDGGSLTFDDRPISAPSPERAVIFQNSALFPWLNVRDNIGYGLKMRNTTKKLRYEKEKEYLEAISLEGFEEFYPAQLSGGMQQRVALARVLVMRPLLLLMDEPFGALDYQSRLQMQQLLLLLWHRYRPTILFVTHDIEEAVLLAHRVVVLSKSPSRIIKEIPVPFKRPRDISLFKETLFNQLKSSILDMLL